MLLQADVDCGCADTRAGSNTGKGAAQADVLYFTGGAVGLLLQAVFQPG